MRLRILSCLLLLAVCFDAAASDLYAEINRLRAGEGNCPVTEKLPPLVPQAALDRAAKGLSRGDSLQQSLKESGYRAVHSSAMIITGEGVGAQAAELLAKYSYCEQLLDTGISEVGVYLEANKVWIVMAAPIAPQAGRSWSVFAASSFGP
jgi:hypothetical protein